MMETGIYHCHHCGEQTLLEIPDREDIAHGSLCRLICAHCDWLELAEDTRNRYPMLRATYEDDGT